MSWEIISNVRPVTHKALAVPHDGVSVAARVLNARRQADKPVKRVSYIKIIIGGGLAKKLCLIGEETRIGLRLGIANHAGHIALAVDASEGAFAVKKAKNGTWSLTVNEGSAEGLFSMTFPAFTAETVSVPYSKDMRPGPPMFAFKATDAMLAVADD